MKKILDKIGEWINALYRKYIDDLTLDGVLHAYVSSMLYMICILLFSSFIGFGYSTLISVGIVGLIGFMKEWLIDKIARHGEFSWEDIKADAIGIVTGLLVSLLLLV